MAPACISLILLASSAVDAQAQDEPRALQLPSFPASFDPSIPGSQLRWNKPVSLLNIANSTFFATTPTRQLAIGDFNALNSVLEGATIDIPEQFETDAGPLWTLYVNNIRCSQLRVGDIIVEASSMQDITGQAPPANLPLVSSLEVRIQGLQFDCSADYRLDKKLLGDSVGSLGLQSRGSDVLTEFALESSQQRVQVTAETTTCQANVQIADLDFSTDSVLGSILNFVEKLIRGPVKNALTKTVCTEMGSVGSIALPEILNQLTEGLDPYLQPLDADVASPLQPEQDLQQELIIAATGANTNTPNPYINFKDNNNHDASDLAHLALDGLDELDAWMGSEIVDSATQTSELAINVLLREMVLDDKGAFVWEMNDSFLKTNVKSLAKTLGTGEGMTLLESHDDLLQTVITLDRISILGLDSLTKFDTFDRIGNHTLQNSLGWKKLTATADVTFTVTPSSLDTSLWSATKPGTQLVEKVQLQLGAKDIQAVLSLFAAIHQDKMGQVPLGALFQSDAIATCLMSTLYPSQVVSGFNLQVSDLGDPTIGGFTSPGLDRVLTEVMDLLYNLYEHWLIKGLPIFAQTTVRDSVNELWTKALNDMDASKQVACPLLDLDVPHGKVPFVDFRDLLLPPEKAKEMGGSGDEPYGDMVSTLFELVSNQLLSVDQGDPNKRLILNPLILDPITQEQSGVAGTVRFETPLVDFEVDNTNRSTSSVIEEIAASLFDSMRLQVANATIRNINTIIEPTSFLQTTRESPYELKNTLQMGPIEGKPLNASVQVRLAVDPFEESGERRLVQTDGMIEHIMELSMSASGLKLAADAMAMVDAFQLQTFHLQDIFNLDCWLATIPAPALDAQGRVMDHETTGLKLKGFLARVMDLGLDVRCVNEECARAGLGVLGDLSNIWEKSNVTTTMGDRYEALATELLTGDYMHNQMARWLDEAPTMCAHNEKYNSMATVFPPLALPVFSPLSIDTMIFTALTGAQAGLLLMSEVDPSMLGLSSASPEVPTTETSENYIDFTSRDGMGNLADIISFLFSRASELLAVENGGINAIVKGMLNEAGLLNLQFDDAPIFEDSNFQLRLNSVWASGLDTFSQFDVLQAVAPQLLQNKIKLERLSVEVDVSIVSGSNEQRVIIAFGAEDVEASLPIYAAINSKALDAFELGSFLEISNMLSCIFTAVENISIPSVELSVGSVTNVSVQGLKPATSRAFAQSMSMIQNLFDIGINGMLNPVLRGVLNGVVSSWQKNAACQNVITRASSSRRMNEFSHYIDFRDLLLPEQESLQYGGTGQSPYGDLFRTVLGFVDDLILRVDPETKLSKVNEILIAPLTKAFSNQTGSIVIPGALVDVENRINVGGLDATFRFRASEARIDSLDTLRDPIALLTPVNNERYLLNNTAHMGIPGDRPLSASVRILLGLENNDGMDLRNDLELTMDMQMVSLILTALLKVREYEFATFPLGDILNLDCWLAKMPASPLDKHGFREAGSEPSATLSELAASLQGLSLKTNCYSCTSEGLTDWNTEGSQDIQGATDRVVNYVTSVLGGKFLQVQIDRALNDAARRCPHSPEYDPNFSTPEYAAFESEHDESATSFLIMLLIVTVAAMVALAVIAFAIRYFVRVRHRRLLKSLPNHQLYLLQKEQERDDKRERELNSASRSLFQSSATIPAFVRYLVPVIILVNIGFFLSGHLSLGATVNIEVQLAGQSFRIEEFFSFSMAKSTIDIWNAGGKALAALIFIFSGLWPYAKQIITLVLWFLPPARCPMEKRGSILLWLDTLAKWSMVDIFVLLVSLAGFRVSIASPELDFLPDNFYSVDLLVVPVWGLYANMIAQIISQISSHFIIHYHRQVVKHAHRARHAIFRKTAGFLEPDMEEGAEGFLDDRAASSTTNSLESEDPEDAARKDKLCEHAFVRPHSNNHRLVARGYVNPLLVFVAVALSALLLAGCILPSFSLEIMGILGVLVESGNGWNQAVEEHSVFTITEMLSDQASFVGGVGNHLGLGTLSGLLVVTVLIVPLVLSMGLLYHWFAPMTKKSRRRLEVALEALHAWQYVEVYLIAMVVASWQLGPISQFMINAYCGSLDETFDMLVYYGILAPKDAQCFTVEASIESAAFMLAVSAILLSFLNSYICNASRQYFRDSERKSKKGLQPAVVAGPAAHDRDDVSAVSSPGQSSVQPLVHALVEHRADKDERDSLGSVTGKSQFHELAVMEYDGLGFKDEMAEDGDVHVVATPVSNDMSGRNPEEGTYVDPLAASPPASNEQWEGDENWKRSDAMTKIHPVPVLFTDKFRWTLQGCPWAVTDTPPTKEDLDPYFPIETDPTSESQSLSKGDSQALMMARESQPLLMYGDAADTIPPTPVQSTGGGSTLDGYSMRGSTIAGTESGEKCGDDAETFRTDEKSSDGGDAFVDEIVQVQNLMEGWESDSEDDEDLFSRGETVDMSVSTGVVSASLLDKSTELDGSSGGRTADSVLVGSGNVLLEPLSIDESIVEEAFQDEFQTNHDIDASGYQTEDSDVLQHSTRVLQSALRDAENSWREGYSTARTSTAHSSTSGSGTHSGITQPLRNTSRPQGNSRLQAAFLEEVDL